MNSFFKHFYNSFKEIYGYPIAFIGFLIATVFWLWKPTDKIDLKIFVPVIIVSIILIVILFHLSYTLFQKSQNLYPKVIQGRKPPKVQEGAIALLLLDKSELFSQDAIAAIFLNDEGYERIIGAGYVLSIQTNGIIQIVVIKTLEKSDDDLWGKIAQNDLTIIKKIIVKANVPKILFS